ncbi:MULTISPECIES: site-specific integrase [Pseudomonas]|uniref:site-specific integrase n=1 Tax=Pseudomonas TaxID=286 RepID=UPI00156D6BEE|nr:MULTISPECIES: site-specific integrase [Pseudomonas]MBP2274274.1 hypothetical protein [Pseudomonas sp. BP6]MBP2286755.1 hypothetical protein [Pseudomonas sp. BP7]QKL10070.1 hypothetical protein GEV41_28175 [Pseudomonas putida]WVM66939.1 site-specific integrase [Pseudomonas putida]WVM70084.1 site-specific integrase [Pseudomonas putida]
MRLRLALDEFLRHKEAITACYNYCLELYSAASGSLAKACQNPPIEKDAPLTRKYRPVNTPANSQEYMIFTDVAKKFGIYDLLDEWIGHKQGIGVFSQYFAFITTVGTAYIVNFTMMRIDETHSLRTDCFSSETDPSTNEKIYIIKGETTKTLQDDDARWITSPSVAVAVEAMTIVAHLKTIAAKANPDVSLTEEDVTNPYLILRPYEPWRKQSRNISQPTKIRPAPKNYSTAVGKMKKLFNPKELEITPDDFEVARRITPDINPETFRIGEPWPLAWHQLRRTGAVNMLASGLVTDASLQYQLKHVSRTMTRYYASGYYSASFKLNGEARSEYIREMYVNAAREISSLRSERFVSPHGEKRKKQLFNLIAVKDHTELVRAAKQGNLPYRATILGGCANPAPCSYGGIDCIVHCAGGDGSPACEHALYDRSSVKKLLILKNETEQRLRSSTDGSPLRTALEYQITALDNVLHAIT